MFRTKPLTTLLLITRDRLVRADVGGGRVPRLESLRQEPRPAVDDLPSLVEAALQLGRARPGRVWVLASDVWTQTLSLSAETTSGLDAADLARALAFEAEPFSGLSGLDARTAFVELATNARERVFWLSAVAGAQFAQIDALVQQAGGRLAGVAHPGGLPAPLVAENRGHAWQRIELWPGSLVCVRGGPQQARALRIVNNDPKPGRWTADAERWLAETSGDAPVEWLQAAATAAVDEFPSGARLRLDDDDALARFCLAWAASLSQRASSTPLVRAPRRPLSTAARQAIAVSLAAAALAVCCGHYLATDAISRRQAAQTERLRGPIARFEQLKKEANESREQAKKLQAECERLAADAEACRTAMQSQRQRVATLIRTLARQDTGRMIVEKIDAQGDGLVLQGVCLTPQAADKLVHELSVALEPLGWRVRLPKRAALAVAAGGGPWRFEVQLSDAVAADRAAADDDLQTPPQGKRRS